MGAGSESGSSGRSLFLRGNGLLLGFGVGLAGATEVLSGTAGVLSGLLTDVGEILGKCIRLLVVDRSEIG